MARQIQTPQGALWSSSNPMIKDTTYGWVDVTPELAIKWLELNTLNRSIRDKLVKRYARDIEGEAFLPTGQAVIFDKNGDLIDGQHRLWGVIESGRTTTFFVIWGVDPSCKDVIDTGAKRSAGDVLSFHGYTQTSTLASTAKLLYGYVVSNGATVTTNRDPSVTELRQVIEDNPEILESVKYAATLKRDLSGVMTPSVIGFTHWRLSKISPDKAKEFFDSLAFSKTEGRGDPRYALLNKLHQLRGPKGSQQGKLSNVAQTQLIIRSWNSWRRNEKRHILRYQEPDGSSIQPSIPKPI